jgi:GNAT superfamily N-acetyltransferase
MDGIIIRHHVLRVVTVPETEANEAAEASRALCASADLLARIEDAAAETDTSPTRPQQDAGNYRKGKLNIHGLTIAIENPKGSERSGISPDGKEWSQKMHSHYGYILGTEGRDKDHIDVFIGDEHPHSELIFVVNQVDPAGRFDEHKCIIGAVSEAEARKMYLDNYEDGWRGLGAIYPLTMPQFKWWLEHADTTREIESGMFAKYRKKAADDGQIKSAFGNDGRDDDHAASTEAYGASVGVHSLRDDRADPDKHTEPGGDSGGGGHSSGDVGQDQTHPRGRERGNLQPGYAKTDHKPQRRQPSVGGVAEGEGYTYSDFPDAFGEYGPEHRFDATHHGRNVGSVSVMELPEKDRRWIRGLYVSPRHRGRGVAKRLLANAVDKFGDKTLELHAGPYKDKPVDADALMKFYSTMDFTPGTKNPAYMTRAARSKEASEKLQHHSGDSAVHGEGGVRPELLAGKQILPPGADGGRSAGGVTEPERARDPEILDQGRQTDQT